MRKSNRSIAKYHIEAHSERLKSRTEQTKTSIGYLLQKPSTFTHIEEIKIAKQCYPLITDDICRGRDEYFSTIAGWQYVWLVGASTHNSQSALSNIYQISRNIHSTQVKAILRSREDPTMTTNNMSKTKLVVFKSQNPPPTQLAPLLSIG